MKKITQRQKMFLKTLGVREHTKSSWEIVFHDDFLHEYNDLSTFVQDELIALAANLRERGPLLGRPQVDTLKGSVHANMKEMRFVADGGVWRVAFAFDPERNAIVLVAGNKSGVSQRQFYQSLIQSADERFKQHLRTVRLRRGEGDAGHTR